MELGGKAFGKERLGSKVEVRVGKKVSGEDWKLEKVARSASGGVKESRGHAVRIVFQGEIEAVEEVVVGAVWGGAILGLEDGDREIGSVGGLRGHGHAAGW